MTHPFDAYGKEYRDVVQSSIDFSGLSYEFVTVAKADVMREVRQSIELLGDDTTHDARIGAFLKGVVTRRDGRYEFPPGPQMAIISWEKST